MRLLLALVVVLCVFASSAWGAYCSGKPDEGERVSKYPIFDGDVKFEHQIKNAKYYTAGPEGKEFAIVHLWGTPYEMGYAQGIIRKKAIVEFVTKTWGYLMEMLVEEFPEGTFSPAVEALIVNKGMDRALDWTIRTTAPFTPQAFLDEMRGLADATGLSYDLIYRLNMFPELSKASCSFLGAWGSAVKIPGTSFQLRALDYDTVGPFKDFPQVTIYHPNDGNAFAQVGWPGNLGVLTGFSSQQLAISEIGVSFPDESFGQGLVPDTPPEKVHGEPWMFILRDVLQYESTLDAGIKHIQSANRTCNLIIGLGDGKAQHAYGIQYSGYVANPYDDKNLLPANETWHPVVEDTVYNGMDWLCPNFDIVLGQQLAKYHGAIDENVIIGNILPTVQTGNLHIAVYDLGNSNMHVSFSRPASEPETEPEFAYERQFTRLHMAELFKEAMPSL